jgi:N-methylhydantoinase A
MASAFSAFGLSLMDVLHVYEKNWTATAGRDEIREGAESLTERAFSDMRGEGFHNGNVGIMLQLMGGRENRKIVLEVRGKEPEQWKKLVTQAILANQIPDEINSLILHVIGQTATCTILPTALGTANPNEAFVEERAVFLKGEKSTIPVFSREKLVPGNEIQGPAIVEAPDTTYVINKTWHLGIDAYDNAMVTKKG